MSNDLFVAILEENYQEIKKLLYSGIDANILDVFNNTPLHYAVDTCNIEIVRVLLKFGANLVAKNVDNKTPLDIYYESKSSDLNLLNELAFWEAKFTPNNGSLFLATTMAYLVPVCNNNVQFKRRFTLLFGEAELDVSGYIKTLISYYSLYFRREIVEGDETLERLTNVVLRNKVADNLNSYDFKDFNAYKKHKKYLRDPNSPFDHSVWKVVNEILGLKNVFCHGFQLIRAEFLMDAWKRGISSPLFSGICNINYQDQDNGRTLLHYAIYDKKNTTINVLLSQGAKSNIIDYDDLMSFDIGRRKPDNETHNETDNEIETSYVYIHPLEKDMHFELMINKFSISENYIDQKLHDNELEKVWKERKTTFGPCSWQTLSVMNKFALKLMDQCQYEQATKIYDENMDGIEQYWSLCHPITLKLKMNMCKALIHTKKYDQSSEILNQVSKYHKFIPWVKNNKAIMLHDEGNYKDALKLYDEILSICEPENKLTFLHNRMCILKACGKRANLEEMVSSFYKSLTSELETNIIMMLHVAAEYRQRENYDRAMNISTHMYDISKNHFSPNHAVILSCEKEIGFTHYCKKNYKEAFFYFRRTQYAYGIALIMYALNTPRKATKILIDVLREKLRIRGPYHPETLTVANNFAFLLREQMLYHESLEVFREVEKGREISLGNLHEKTLRTVNSVGVMLVHLNRPKDAMKIFQKGVALAKRDYFISNLKVVKSLI